VNTVGESWRYRMTEKELVSASPSYVWIWRKGSIAHLIPVNALDKKMPQTLCAKRVRTEGCTAAFKIGGHSSVPCPKCQEIARLEMAEEGERCQS